MPAHAGLLASAATVAAALTLTTASEAGAETSACGAVRQRIAVTCAGLGASALDYAASRIAARAAVVVVVASAATMRTAARRWIRLAQRRVGDAIVGVHATLH